MKKSFLTFVLGVIVFLCSSAVYAQTGNHNLFEANSSTGTRTFTLTVPIYNIDSSLGVTGWGDFTVKGSGAPSAYVLSGVLISTDGTVIGVGGSFFNISQADTSFTLQDITVSSANIIGSGSVIILNNAASNALITNAILDGNNATQNGGAINSLSGSLEASNVIMRNNGAISWGGAIYNQTSAFLEAVLFDSNNAANGGAIFNSGINGRIYFLGTSEFDSNHTISNGGAIYNNTSAVIMSTAAGSFMSFSSNTAMVGSGGAIYNASQITIAASEFIGNTAGSAAGAVFNTGIVNLKDSNFEYNRAANGGALYNNGATAAFNISGNVFFDSNSANTNGGAVYNAGIFSVTSSAFVSFDSNNAANGGAFYNTGNVSLSSAEFINNMATLNGGAIYNSGALNLVNVIMSSNTAVVSGGAVYNLSTNALLAAQINVSGNVKIEHSISTLNGGAIFNGAGRIDVLTGGSLSFIDNASLLGSGGAIYNSSGSFTSQTGSYVIFSSNTAYGSGGAIYVDGSVTVIVGSNSVNLLGTSIFNGNSAYSGAGGAIYNGSTDQNGGVYIGGPAQFTGNSAATLGGAIYNLGKFYLDSSSGDIIFSGNKAAGLPNDLYNDLKAALYINGDAHDVIFGGGIAGQSASGEDFGIFKTGLGRLLVSGNSSNYTGNFFLEEGQAIFSAGFFTGTSEITGGILDIAQGGNITSGIIRVYESGIMNIDTADNLVFSGQFVGDPDGFAGGVINKTVNSTGTLTFLGAQLSRPINIYAGVLEASTGTVFTLGESVNLFNKSQFLVTTPGTLYLYNGGLSGGTTTYAANLGGGTLNIIGNNSGFSGTFDQSSGGVTNVTSSRGQYGSMFTGVNNIYDSILNVNQTYFTRNSVVIGYDVNLFNNSAYNYRNRTVAQTIINPDHVTFYGDNSTAYFGKARELVRFAQYTLVGEFADYGVGNRIVFEGSIVNLPSSNYTVNDYTFLNSIFDLTANNSTHSVTFDRLTLGPVTGSNGIKIGIDFIGGNTVVADELHTDPALVDKLYLYDLKLYYGANDYVTPGIYYAPVLFGGLTFDENATKSYTAIRQYNTFDLTMDTVTLTQIMIGVTGGINYHSLYTRNAETGNRSFSVQFEGMTYYIDMPLDDTTDTKAGIFIVSGGENGNRDASKYTISGILVDSSGNPIGGKGSFFNLQNATKFELWNITMADALIATDGSILRMTNGSASAVFSNAILHDNLSNNRGGAIFANAGELYIDSVTAYNNYASSGGVVYVAGNVSVKFDNSARFVNNNAYAGGAIYADSLSSRIFIENTYALFDSNHAAGSGGAIFSYNSPIDLVDSAIVFSSNTAADFGGAIMLDNSNINFIGGNILFSGNKAEEGGAIYGTDGVSNLNFSENYTRFANNNAENGGAIAIVGSTMTMALAISNVLFEDNVAASGKGADIYMNNAGLNIVLSVFNSLWTDYLTLKGGIYVETDQNVINKTGPGVFTLMGENYIQGAFNVSGGIFNVTSASYLHENGTFTLTASRGMYVSGSTMTFANTADVIMADNAYDKKLRKFDNSFGRALNVSSQSIITFEGNADFINNNTEGFGGGAIYNDGSEIYFNSSVGKKINFTSNETTVSSDTSLSNGGAIRNVNNALMAFSGGADISFSSNSALAGGAISNEDGSQIIFNGVNVVFAQNTADGSAYGNDPASMSGGGAIYNSSGAAILFNNGAAANFVNNTAVLGGAIANFGSADLIADNSAITFSGNAAAGSGGLGGAVYNAGTLNLVTENGGQIIFSSSSANMAAGSANDIYNAAGAVINIEGSSGAVTVSGGIRGVAGSVIKKSGGNTFNINGNSSGYSGRFEQTSGLTVVTSNYFTGVSSISAGILELSTGSALSGGTIGVWGPALLEITTSGDLTFYGNITGDGTINKELSAAGRLTLSGNNSAFTGYFNQYAGTTTVNTSGRMFAGTNTISASLLEVYSTAGAYYTVNLSTSGILNHYASNLVVATIGGDNIKFTASGANAVFGASGISAKANYNLASKMDNGQNNTVTFNNSFVVLQSTDYTGVTDYIFNNSTIDLMTGVGTSTKTIEFTNLQVSNTSLDFGINFRNNTGMAESDILRVVNGLGNLNLGFIRIRDDYDSGLNIPHYIRVLDGINFNPGKSANIATLTYEYVVSVATNTEYVILIASRATDEYSLDRQNMKYGERAFLFSYLTGDRVVYNEGDTLHTMSSGVFTVAGYDSDASHSVLSGMLVYSTNTSTGRGSFFHIIDGQPVYFTLMDLTVSSAHANGTSQVSDNINGSVLNISGDESTATIKNVIFDQNEADGLGGVIYAASGTVVIESAVFVNNIAQGSGGAAYFANALIELNNVVWTSNTAVSGSGGAIYVSNTKLDFDNYIVNFTSNTAGLHGGAIYSENGAKLTFGATTVNFIGNKVLTGNGGAIAAIDDISFDSTTAYFVGNTALGGLGGAIYAENTLLTLINASMTFTDNKALLGGAIAAVGGSSVTLNGIGIFLNNAALSAGGAIYISSSAVTIDASNGDMIFTGNTAAGKPNDIFLDNYAQLIFSGANDIILNGGILSNSASTGIAMKKIDSGTMYLGGTNKVNGAFNVEEGTVKFIDAASYEGGELRISSGTTLDLHNGYANTISAETFVTGGDLKLDIFADKTNDKIYAGNAEITGGNLEIMVASGTYYNDRYYLIISTYSLDGKFTASSLSDNTLRYRLFYDDKNVWLDINYNYVSTFSKLSPMTFNQSETAKAIDSISRNPSPEWGAFIDHMMWDLNKSQQLNILSRISGYFYANVVRNAAADIPSKQIYDKIRNHAEKDTTSCGFWAQVKGSRETWYGDENSLGDYKDLSFGAMAGFDRYIDETGIMWGIFAGLSKDNIEQELNKADGNRISFGAYGGLLAEKWELKGLLQGSVDKFDTTREVFGKFTYGNINAFTLSADVEGALRYNVADNTTFRPFVGFDLANVSYKAFNETDIGIYTLNVNGGNYLRTSARLGAGLEYERKNWSAYASAEARLLITGNKPEVESVFENTNAEFLSRGTTEGQIQGGVNVGAEARVIGGLKVFANGNLTAASRYSYYGGNAGLRYVFCKRSSLIGKNLAKALKYAKAADKESITVHDFAEAGKMDEAWMSAKSAIGEANISMDIAQDVRKEITFNDANRSAAEISEIDEKLMQINNINQRAKDRLLRSLFGVSELEESTVLVDKAEKHLDEANNLRMIEAPSSGDIETEALQAFTLSDKALQKSGSGLEKIDQARDKIQLADGIISKSDVNTVEAQLKQIEERARRIQDSANEIIKSADEKDLQEANERRSTDYVKMTRITIAHFASDDATLRDFDRRSIEKLARDLIAMGYERITVEGHTDEDGTYAYNLTLSLKRAKIVRDTLIKNGIDPKKIDYAGFGNTMPITTNETKEGKQANRRVEIFIE